MILSPTSNLHATSKLNVAFYAPMKSPEHPVPSGDRYIARLLMKALRHAGFNVDLVSQLRSWEGKGDRERQLQLEQQGREEAQQLITHFRNQPASQRPKYWFTYHLYHKAPDWIGPEVCRALDIPYFIAEASISPKQVNGKWQTGYQSSLEAVRQAVCVFNLNPADLVCLKEVASPKTVFVDINPFLEKPPQLDGKNRLRQKLALEKRLDPNQYWLICVAMMREDSKLDSYFMLADAVQQIERKDWQLIVIGDGQAQQQVVQAFNHCEKVRFLGVQETDYIYQCLHASDLFVWPAINEAFGMVTLEALACGLPVVAGRFGGIGQIVDHQKTGWLIEDIDSEKLARRIEQLLGNPGQLAEMSRRSLHKFQSQHRIETAARKLKDNMLPAI